MIRTPGFSAGRISKLLGIFGAGETIVTASGQQLARAGVSGAEIRWLHRPDKVVIEKDLDWLDQPDHHLITLEDSRYPRLLRETIGPPAALFVTGNPSLLAEPQLAMVGSRNPTPTGKRTAEEFAAYLARCGLVITSGLALGIDAASHRGALAAGGATVAVCGTGLDIVYPARHKELAREIAATGALVSEFPPGTEARREYFPQRNRIISGLSIGTLVVEAALQSGSLITARLAGEQGREVFAIPGSIHNPLARGCHRLLRQGAKLVESARDILEELAPLLDIEAPVRPATRPEPAAEAMPDEDYRILLNSLDTAPTSVDALVDRTGLTPDVVSSMLLMLELQGHVEAAPGGRYTRVTKRPPR